MILINTIEDYNKTIESAQDKRKIYHEMELSDDFIKNNIKLSNKGVRIDYMLLWSKFSNNIIPFLYNLFENYYFESPNEMFYNLFINQHFKPTEEMITKYNLVELQLDFVKKHSHYYQNIKYPFPETKEYIKLITL